MKRVTVFLLLLSMPSMMAAINKKHLFDHAFNMYSQFGEDGVIKKIFDIIGTQSKVLVEFGAWDGFYLSNTANLWSRDLSWKGVLIESDKERYNTLVKNVGSYNCVAINALVGIDSISSIETILKNHGIAQEIDLMSIDVDGNEYYIFESLKTLRPRLIICEYNPTIPVVLDLYADYSSENRFGQSVAALSRIAQEKGYKLIALTRTNAFYILEADYEKFAEYETEPRLIDVNDYAVCVTTYDGKYAFVSAKPCLLYGLNYQYTQDINGNYTRIDPVRLAPAATTEIPKIVEILPKQENAIGAETTLATKKQKNNSTAFSNTIIGASIK